MSLRAMNSSTCRALNISRRARGFHSTGVFKSSPYHYPEGPRSNLPFNPLTRFFIVRYWAFMAVGFGAPFGIAVWQTYKNG
ncbi:putative cytochrome-c oxidase chain viic [Golovinomyces cichoracearum]|uniref:Cytochrome c oxidase subunit 8, mitochondrial n=1 Tax=Golovinomyces cichoracearum TaxID=62708 RepID=A0A420J0Q5_9PEZI|nr:putative cytochrome-c oxidase chain viic [Golovinomyces cichoracearum]